MESIIQRERLDRGHPTENIQFAIPVHWHSIYFADARGKLLHDLRVSCRVVNVPCCRGPADREFLACPLPRLDVDALRRADLAGPTLRPNSGQDPSGKA